MNSPLSSINNFIKFLFLFLTFIGYVVLLYFIPRNNFYLTYTLIAFLFVLYYLIVKKYSYLFSLKLCISVAFILRFISLFNYPALSDDYFRFLWDGEMTIRHINPFAYTPDIFIAAHPDVYLKYLHDKMNSAEYYTVYPAILQYIFASAAKLFPTNEHGGIIILKAFIFISESFTTYVLYKYCRFKNIDARNILWYVFNPLVIIELSGNVHFEALLILFLISTLYYLEKNNLWLAALCWACAVCSKLLPLMLAPIFLNYLGFARFTKVAIIALVSAGLLFLPFIDPTLLNIQYSVGKFYDLFEFNASFYYLFNWIAGAFTVKDISDYIAQFLGILSLLIILLISFYKFRKTQLLTRSFLIFSIFFLCSTMVHPWYITTLIAFTTLINYRAPVIFSLLLPLSYFPYSLKIFNENMYIIFIEYSLLFAYVFIEYKFPVLIKKYWNLPDNREIMKF